MNKLKRFCSTTLVYFAGIVLPKVVVFFLLPLYTSRINPDQYGIYDLVLAFINLLAPILFLQIWDGMFRVSFEYTEEKDKYKVIANSFAVCLFGTIIYTLIYFVVQGVFHIEYSLYIFAYGLVFSFQYLYGFICRVFLDNRLYVVSGLINTVITVILNVVLIVVFNWDVRSLYFAPIVGMVVQILIIEIRYGVFANCKIDYIEKDIIKRMIKFSVPLCLASVSFWLLSGYTKSLITGVLGATENGLFAVANRFASAITIMVAMFQYAWNELAYIISNDSDRSDTYNICIDLLLKFVILGSAGICILVKVVFPFFIHEQYGDALYVVPATIIGSGMNIMANFVGTLFLTEKKTNGIMYSTLIAAAVNVVVGYLSVRIFGLHGVTIALCLSFVVLMLIRLIQSNKLFNISYNVKSIIVISLVLVASIIEFYCVKNLLVDILSIAAIGVVFTLSIKKYLVMIIKR